MANILTDKKFLDVSGVKVIVSAIEKLKNNTASLGEELNGRIDDLLVELGLPVDGEGQYADGSILRDIYDLIADLDSREIADRADLDALRAAYDAYVEANDARVQAVEDRATDLEGRADALEGRADAVEARLDGFDDEAFTSVKSVYDPATHKIHVHFGSHNTEVTGDMCSDECTGVGSFTIDTDDFVKNGMIQKVEMITVPAEPSDLNDEWKAQYVDIPSEVLNNQAFGKKYIVISFNTQSEQASAPGAHEDGETTSMVWLAVDGLFNDYDFDAVSTASDYVTLEAQEVPSLVGDQVNKATYTVGLGAKAVEDFSLVEGIVPVEGGVAPAEGTSVLMGKINDLRQHYYGVKEVSVAIDELDKVAAQTKAKADQLRADLDALNASFDAFVEETNDKIDALDARDAEQYENVVETFNFINDSVVDMKADLEIALDFILDGTPIPAGPNMFID